MVFPLAKKLTREQCATIFFAVLVFLFYGNTLQNGFVQDDISQVEKNIYLRSIKNIPKVFTSCIWEYANKGCKGRTFYYRPFHYLSYFLVYQLSPEPWIFHLANLTYFLLAVYLVFLLAKKLTNSFAFAFTSALIFLIHPINSEVVNWVSAGSEIIYVIFSLSTLIFYVQYRQSGLKKNLAMTYVFYFFALLSKESALFLPLVIFAADIFLIRQDQGFAEGRFLFKKRPKGFLTGKELKKYLLFGIPFLIYFLMRSAVIGTGANFFGDFNFGRRLYLSVLLFGKYLGKVLFPYPLQPVYDFSTAVNFSQPGFFLSLFFSILFLGLFMLAIKKNKGLVAFSFVWFGIFLAPVIIFLQAAGAGINVFFERYLLGSVIGFSFALAYLLCFVFKIQDFLFKKSSKGIFVSFLVIAIVVVCHQTVFAQNEVWRNSETLYLKALERAPDAHSFRYPLGVLYYEKGEIAKAKKEFEEIIQRGGGKWEDATMVYKGLGDCYRDEGDSETALFYYQKAVETAAPSPRDYVTFNDLGVAYVEKGNYLKGLIYFCQALQLYPEAETVSINFNGALDLIETDYRQKKLLYQKITEELALTREEKIRYLNRICGEDTCQYLFSFSSPMPEVLLPSLISAISLESAKEIYLNNPSFQLGQGVISIEIEKAFSDKELRFIFPSCSGVFYQLEVMPEADKL